MKGIILAGGAGTRLYPLTLTVSKQLLPIYDKPMIFYPLSVLMLSGVKEILIICTPKDLHLFRELLGDGSGFGVNIAYEVQAKPEGIAQAFMIAEKFIGNDGVTLILGDNIFFGNGLSSQITEAMQKNVGATIFGYHVSNPSDFGVLDLGDDGKVNSIVEKPLDPNSNTAVTGLYVFDNSVIDKAKRITRSERGELEIVDVLNIYLHSNKLNCIELGRGITWLDTGTHENLIAASQFICAIENRQGLKVACLEEIGFKKSWLSKQELCVACKKYGNSPYGQHLTNLAKSVGAND